jgi:hypothetical protein
MQCVQAEHQVNTLIDGLIVEDQDHDKKVARYLAFDILFLEGTPVWQKKLEKRLQCLQNEIILPRKNVSESCAANEAIFGILMSLLDIPLRIHRSTTPRSRSAFA